MRLPLGPGDRRQGIEHRNGAGFVTVALFAVDRLNAGKRLGVVANRLDLAAQGRLVVFQLNDQMRLRIGGGFECFFGNAWRRA
jgi:hypothetical protein